MGRLSIVLAYSLLINWMMFGLSLAHIHNAWLADPAYLVEALLYLAVLAGLGTWKQLRRIIFPSGGFMVISGAWDGWHIGLANKWPLAETSAGVVLLGICLWLMFNLLVEKAPDLIWNQPAFWLLGSWALIQAVNIMFYPLHNLFLKNLTREWILVPWFTKFLAIFVLNLGVARTFLCPKPSSS